MGGNTCLLTDSNVNLILAPPAMADMLVQKQMDQQHQLQQPASCQRNDGTCQGEKRPHALRDISLNHALSRPATAATVLGKHSGCVLLCMHASCIIPTMQVPAQTAQ